MKYLSELLSNWPFAVWALGLAAVFYFVVAKGSGHLSQDNRARLSLYLEGSYKGSWAENFCDLFDKLFGANHFSITTFLRSAVASFAAVAAIYALLGPILGLLTVRTTSALDLFTALAVGALVNIIPDYISLWETRWMLSTFKRFRNPFVQFGLLILDLVISALIIAIWISAFLFVTGQDQISWVEMIAVYSTYAVFFYSTFLTSLWAWGYCASSWFVKTFTFLRLHKLLDMNAPGKSLALTGAVAIFAGAFAVKPLASSDFVGLDQFDAQLCTWFPNDACEHAARLTLDDIRKFEYLVTSCDRNTGHSCLGPAMENIGLSEKQTFEIFRKACSVENAIGCTRLGYMYKNALGVPQDYDKAVDLYRQGCDGGNALGCTNLGAMYDVALGVPQDYAKAIDLYRQGCDEGNALGCSNLGAMYDNARGVPQNYAKAIDLYRQGCDEGEALGCTNLGWMFENTRGVDQDLKRAETLYLQACDMGDSWACEKMKTFKDVPK